MMSGAVRHGTTTSTAGLAGTNQLTSGEPLNEPRAGNRPEVRPDEICHRTAPTRSVLEQLRVSGDGRPYLFVQALLADFSCTGKDAAIIAGYSPKTAASQASRLLTRANIQAALAEGRAQLAERFEITKDKVTQEVAALAYSRLDDVFDIDRLTGRWSVRPGARIPDRARRALKKVKVTTRRIDRGKDLPPIEEQRVEIEMHSKDAALEKLMSHLGLYSQATPPELPKGLVVQVVAAFTGSPPPLDCESRQIVSIEPTGCGVLTPGHGGGND